MQYDERMLISDIRDISDYVKRMSCQGVSFDGVYGVPRGGKIPAAMLAQTLDLPLRNNPRTNTLIVDDIVDSGRTRDKFKEHVFVCLVQSQKRGAFEGASYYARTTFEWVNFFWEESSATNGEDIVVRMIERIGDDPTRPGIVETPKRVIKAWDEMFAGYKQDPKTIIKAGFQEQPAGNHLDGIIYLRDIEFFSTCEHHILPFYGKAHVAYIPKDGKVVGISKLARLVDCFARRLQIQERIANQVVDAIMEFGALGAICIIEAKHLCIACRGVAKQHSIMGCSAIRGVFESKQEARAEALSLLLGK